MNLADAAHEDASGDQLAQCLSDVRALVTLPALCRGKPALDILTRFCKAVEVISAPELVVACIQSARGTIRVTRLRGRNVDDRADEVHAWFSGVCHEAASTCSAACGSLGELMVACQPLAHAGARGYLIVGARNPAFPSPRELVMLETAAALAASALESAAALGEREATLKAKEEFLAVLGHELRNPLAPIVNALDLMQLRKSGVTSREELVMRRQVEHLGTLVDDLLDMSKLSRGLLTLQTSQQEIVNVIDEAVAVTAPLFKARGHELSVRVPPRGLPVDADRARLVRALETLLANAAKYTPAGGRVTIEAKLQRNRVLVTVRDNGSGIAPELLPHVFDKFVHGQDGSDFHYGGLGLGLSITRTLVELHGGSVSAHSAGLGCGSEFSISLPLADADAESEAFGATSSQLPEPASGAPGRIFILDDNVDAAEMLGETLTLAGYQVKVERDSSRALAAVDEFRPAFAILDIGMPDLNGYEVAHLIRSRLTQPPTLIALTGYGQPSDRERSAQAGFVAHLVKPIEMATLLRVITSIASRAGQSLTPAK